MFRNGKYRGTASRKKDSRKQTAFQKAFYLCYARGNRRREIFSKLVNQSQMQERREEVNYFIKHTSSVFHNLRGSTRVRYYFYFETRAIENGRTHIKGKTDMIDQEIREMLRKEESSLARTVED